MSGDDHQRARDEGAWEGAPTSSEGTGGEEVESNDEQQPEAIKSSNDQPDEQAESSDEEGQSSPSTDESNNDQGDEQVKPADSTDPWGPDEQRNDQQKGTGQGASNSNSRGGRLSGPLPSYRGGRRRGAPDHFVAPSPVEHDRR